MNRTANISLWLALAFLAGCSRGGSRQSADAGSAASFMKMKVTDEANHFLYTYLVADGTFRTVDKVADVPKEARGQVVVTDTGLSPEQRHSSKIIYVADLSEKREDGSYACRPVSRFKFERDLLREPGSASTVLPEQCKNIAKSPTDHVVLYATSWCGVCKAAAAFLTKSGIPYEEKDVEKDRAAQQELTCKALKTGTKINGVPVIDIGGTLLLGFDRDDILRLAKKLKPIKRI
ncbi:MAG TPA: glutaredoxin domain-containing protein [Myxococcota bacterium]|nr:glutaredoxin domain-containing protein [Myxococcota bacterium]